ncbi:MAG: ribonuclease P protein component [Phycisphaera sp.]|nr:MAG: ribonuclease P protein component [Phycisphaera sp.]
MTPTQGQDSRAPRQRAVYRKHHRLTHSNEFKAVYEARLKKPIGPIVVFALPNKLGHPRLGLSIGRRVGGAVTRNAVKRRLRDAFRQIAAGWPEEKAGLDLVIVVRPHETRSPASYQSMLESAIDRLIKLIEKQAKEPEP